MICDISVIICAYTEKRWNELLAAVTSVQQQTLPPKETIVVIDRNPSLQLRVQEALPDVIVIENCRTKGASGARNSGTAIAQGNILAFLDDDAIANPDWLEQMAACYTNPDVVGAGGKILPNWSTRCPSWFPDEFYWVIGCSYRGLPPENAPVRNVIGANMSVRKDVLVQVGGFLEAFGNNKEADAGQIGTKSKWLHHAGDEETELCIRVTQCLPNSKWLYTPAAVVQHSVPRERTRWGYFLWRCYDEGLGKAGLVELHDSQTSLSSERSYVFKVLPKGVLRYLADILLHFDLAGGLRSGAIVMGLTMTVAGYIRGSIPVWIRTFKKINLAPLRS